LVFCLPCAMTIFALMDDVSSTEELAHFKGVADLLEAKHIG